MIQVLQQVFFKQRIHLPKIYLLKVERTHKNLAGSRRWRSRQHLDELETSVHNSSTLGSFIFDWSQFGHRPSLEQWQWRVWTCITLNVDTRNQRTGFRSVEMTTCFIGALSSSTIQLVFSGENKAAEHQSVSQQKQTWFFLDCVNKTKQKWFWSKYEEPTTRCLNLVWQKYPTEETGGELDQWSRRYAQTDKVQVIWMSSRVSCCLHHNILTTDATKKTEITVLLLLSENLWKMCILKTCICFSNVYFKKFISECIEKWKVLKCKNNQVNLNEDWTVNSQ